MLSNGQIEVRKIINSYLENYENLQVKKATQDEYDNLYEKVRDVFCSNNIIKSDLVTSQLLTTSGYSKNYLQWLTRHGEKESLSWGNPYLKNLDFPMREILYSKPYIQYQPEPAYKGGEKWDSTISCLFGLAQGKSLNSPNWDSLYYDAIKLWRVGSGGNHRLLAHILFGENRINPNRLIIIRNDFVDQHLNKSLCQFDELFESVNSSRGTVTNNYVELAFNVESLSAELTLKIKDFFSDIKVDEQVDLVRCINAIKKYPHKYISSKSISKEIDIHNMYLLLNDIRDLRSKPWWYRELLILKQKLFGIRSVNPVTCSVLNLANRDTLLPDGDVNDEGFLGLLPGLREALLILFSQLK